jgi:hypothetical protein
VTIARAGSSTLLTGTDTVFMKLSLMIALAARAYFLDASMTADRSFTGW